MLGMLVAIGASLLPDPCRGQKQEIPKFTSVFLYLDMYFENHELDTVVLAQNLSNSRG